MTSEAYMTGRNKYGRPQAMVFSNNAGVVENGFHVPTGTEFVDFIVLSDHNRDPISFKSNRIESKVRTINGRMRSYHIADKLSISTSWKTLPSRSASSPLTVTASGTTLGASETAYIVDSGAAAVDILDWYENHQGSFFVFLAYDKFNNFESDTYNKLGRYNEVIEVFFEDFQYDVNKRGRATHDFWDISLSLEEV
jgi:hypothetical protein